MNAAIISDIQYVKYCLPVQLLATANAATPTRVTSTQGTYFRRATVLGCNALSGTANAGTVNLGYASAANQQPFQIPAGQGTVFEAPVGAKHDLYDLYFVTQNNGDGVVVLYS